MKAMNGIKTYMVPNIARTLQAQMVRVRSDDVTFGSVVQKGLPATAFQPATIRMERSVTILKDPEKPGKVGKSVLMRRELESWLRVPGGLFIPNRYLCLPSTQAKPELRPTELEGPFADPATSLEYFMGVRGQVRFQSATVSFASIIEDAGGTIPATLELKASQIAAFVNVLTPEVGKDFFYSFYLPDHEFAELFEGLIMHNQCYAPFLLLMGMSLASRQRLAAEVGLRFSFVCSQFGVPAEEMLSGNFSADTRLRMAETFIQKG